MKNFCQTFELNTAAVEQPGVPRTFRFVASTESQDSHGRVVAQDWDLSRFQKNPVVLWNHGKPDGLFATPDTDVTLPIGFAPSISADSTKLECVITLVDERANPLAEKVYQGIKQGSIRAISVGWRAGACEVSEDGSVRLSQNELYEISVVAIPSNADAVMQAASFRSSVTHAFPVARANQDTQEQAKGDALITDTVAATRQRLAKVDADMQRSFALVPLREPLDYTPDELATIHSASLERYDHVMKQREALRAGTLPVPYREAHAYSTQELHHIATHQPERFATAMAERKAFAAREIIPQRDATAYSVDELAALHVQDRKRYQEVVEERRAIAALEIIPERKASDFTHRELAAMAQQDSARYRRVMTERATTNR